MQVVRRLRQSTERAVRQPLSCVSAATETPRVWLQLTPCAVTHTQTPTHVCLSHFWGIYMEGFKNSGLRYCLRLHKPTLKDWFSVWSVSLKVSQVPQSAPIRLWVDSLHMAWMPLSTCPPPAPSHFGLQQSCIAFHFSDVNLIEFLRPSSSPPLSYVCRTRGSSRHPLLLTQSTLQTFIFNYCWVRAARWIINRVYF